MRQVPPGWEEFYAARDRVCVFSVYIVGPINGRPVKIGMSHRVNGRIQELNISRWRDEIVFHHECVVGRNGRLAGQIEREAHAALAKNGKYLRGEWFDVDADDALKVVKEIRKRLMGDVRLLEEFDTMTATARIEALKTLL